MQGFYLFVLPFLDRVGDKAGLFMSIRDVVMLFLKNFQGVMDRFSLRGGVGMWHDE